MEFSGVVLAGGASRRMGADKATLVVDDTPLLTRVVRALRAAGADDVLVVGGDPGAADAAGARFEADRWPGEGPLGGLITGLSLIATELAVVAACDLPDIDPDIVHELARALAGDEKLDAVVPTVDGRSQPLLAAYRRRCADALAPAFAVGQRRLDEALHVLVIDRPVRDETSFADLDTPADLAARLQR